MALLPSLRQADLGLLRWHWNPRDEALRTVTRLGAWTFGFVVANQVALFVVTVLAGSVAGPDPVSSYTYAYAFFQLPYGVIAVTVMSVVTPDLAEKWSTGQQSAFLHRMTGGLRAILALIIPSAVGMLLLAKPAVALLLGNGHSTPAETATTGAALGDVRPRAARLLHLPLLRPRAAVDAADQGRLLPLPGGERAQRRRWPSCSSTRSGCAASPCRSRSPTPSPRCLALAVFHQWFGRLAERETWAPVVARRRGLDPDGRRRARGVQPLGVDQRRRAAGPGGRRRSWPAASPSGRSWSGWAGATTRGGGRPRRPAPPPRSGPLTGPLRSPRGL